MPVTRWHVEAIAEMRSLQHGLPARLITSIRQEAQRVAEESGRDEVERLDVCEAWGRLYAPGTEAPETEAPGT